MLFEIRSYQGNTMMTTSDVSKIPTQKELEEMWFNGLKFYWDGEPVTPDRIKIKVKVIKEDEEWERQCLENDIIPADDQMSESETADEVEEQPSKNASQEESNAAQFDTTPSNVSDESDITDESDTAGTLDVNTKHEEPVDDEVETAEVHEELAPAETISKEKQESASPKKTEIHASKSGTDDAVFSTIAAAARVLNIPAYKISDAIKSGKELEGYTFRRYAAD